MTVTETEKVGDSYRIILHCVHLGNSSVTVTSFGNCHYSMIPVEQGLAAYIRYYETLERSSVDQLRELVTADVVFRDPFNDTVGVDAYLNVLQDMFKRCDKTQFQVTKNWLSERDAVLKWQFSFMPAKSKPAWKIEGLSELVISPNGLIELHVDYWDAASQLYERLPAVGWLMRRMKSRLSAI